MKLFALLGSSESGQENAAHRSLILANMRAYAPMLEVAEFYTMVGNADTPRKPATATGGKVRNLDQDYAENTVTPQFGAVALKIFGDKIQVDMAHVRRGQDLASLRLLEIENFAKNLALNFQYGIFNFDKDNDGEFDGILAQVTSAMEIPLNTAINTDALRKGLIKKIMAACDDIPGGPTFIAMDSNIRNELAALQTEYIKYAPANFGSNLVPTINGIPIIIAGKNAAGTPALPFISGDTTGRVVVGRFGEQSDITLATNVGIEVKDLGLQGVHWTTQVDFDVDLAILNPNSVRVITGIISA